MSPKLISIIIPTYNRADLVVGAIESVRAQTYPAMQIIVVDDGSQDQTAKAVARFPEVEYYFQENKGQAAARNLGLKHARGEYIASLDSDDRWHAKFLEFAVSGLEKYDADFVFLNWVQIYEGREFPSSWENSGTCRKFSKNYDGQWALLEAQEIRALYLENCPAPSSALLIKKSSIVGEWNEEMKIADDWYLILEMVLTKPCRAAFSLLPFWTKQIHTTNIYHGREVLEVLSDLGLHDEPLFARDFADHLTQAEKNQLQRRLATHFFNYGRINWQRSGYSPEALKFMLHAFRLAPAGSMTYVMLLSYWNMKNRFRIARQKLGDRQKKTPLPEE